MIFKGNGVVWDTRKNRRLCRFVDGKYETDDRSEIGYLIKRGYEHDGVYEDKVEEKELTKAQIIDKLVDAEIEHNPRDKKEVLLELLDGK